MTRKKRDTPFRYLPKGRRERKKGKRKKREEREKEPRQTEVALYPKQVRIVRGSTREVCGSTVVVEAPPTPSPTPRASKFFSHPPLPKKEEATLRVLGITRARLGRLRGGGCRDHGPYHGHGRVLGHCHSHAHRHDESHHGSSRRGGSPSDCRRRRQRAGP